MNGVYILECANGRYYAGSTNDLERRLAEHRRGHCHSTKYVLPVQLKAFIETETLKQARQLEYSIKKRKSRKHIEELIDKNKIPI